MMKSRASTAIMEETSDIDLTPMLDVVFIMLIFFVVTASFVREVGLEIDRPKGASDGQNESIVFKVKSSGEIWFRERRIDALSVRANVEQALAAAPESSVVVQAENAAKTAAFVQVVDSAREGGASSVALATTPVVF